MKVKQDFVIRNIAGENILVPTGEAAEKFNGMITLNEVAAFIWNNLEKTKDKEDLVDLIMKEFEVDRETAQKDTTGFLNALASLNMIEL